MRRMIGLLAALAASAVAAAAEQPPAPKPAGALSLNSPNCVRVPEARAEQPEDEELGVWRNGEYCAYPLRMMAYHRVVNDHLGGPPILVSYDPDSGVGRVFDPVVDGKPLTFEAVPPRHGLPVLQDHQTGSVWSALDGEALSGPLQGKRMLRIPSLVLTWSRWKALHGSSWVLAEDPKLSPHYTTRVAPVVCRLPSAVARELPRHPDRRLHADSFVLGMSAAGSEVALPLTDPSGRFPARARVLRPTVGDAKWVVFVDPAARAAAAFEPAADRPLTFEVLETPQGPRWRDRETGSAWTLDGRCTEGPLKGKSLSVADAVRVRWYAWSAAHPGSGIAR